MEIDETKLKEILDEVLGRQREEYQHFMGVLAENFQSGLNLIGEQYADIKKTLGSHTEILDTHTETLASHTEILNSHTEMIGSIKMDVEIIKGDIELIKNSLKKKVDFEEFEALEKRVRFLESKIRT